MFNHKQIIESKGLKEDLILIYPLYFTAILLVYFVPSFISYLYFSFLLISFWNSKKNYLWFALFFFMTDSPGGLFSHLDPVHQLPLINLGDVERSIKFSEIFVSLAAIKAYFKGKPANNYFYKNILIVIGLLFVFLLFMSLARGITIFKLLRVIRFSLYFTLLYSIPRLLPKEKDYYRFFYLLFTFIAFVLIVQMAELFLGYRIYSLLGGRLVQTGIEEEKFYRPFYSHFIATLALVASLFYARYYRRKVFIYYLTAIGCLLVPIFSATRGFIIAYLLVIILYIINSGKYVVKYFIPFAVLLIILLNISVVHKQFNKTYERLSEINAFTEENLEIEKVQVGSRLLRSKPVMNRFIENPLFGLAFSDEYFKFKDDHVGNQTILLNCGIVGYSLFLILWGYFLVYIIQLNKSLYTTNPYKNTLLVFVFGFLGYFFIHSTSGRIFGFLMRNDFIGYSILMFYAFANFIVHKAKEENRKIRKSDKGRLPLHLQ